MLCCFASYRNPYLFYLLVHSRCRGFLFSLDHTQTHTTVGRTSLDEGSARRRDLYLITQTLYKRQTSMPPVGFKLTIPARERLQTCALDRAATGIGYALLHEPKIKSKNKYINWDILKTLRSTSLMRKDASFVLYRTSTDGKFQCGLVYIAKQKTYCLPNFIPI
jgi:hypothetical protein